MFDGSSCIARNQEVLRALQGAHRPIGEDEDASQASGVMRQVYTNLRSTSNNSDPLQWAKLESCWYKFLRRMIRGGSSEKTQNKSDFTFKCSRPDLDSVVSAPPQRDFIEAHYLKYTAHTCRHLNDTLTKCVPFARPQRRYCRDPRCRISEILNVSKPRRQLCQLSLMKKNLNFKVELDSIASDVHHTGQQFRLTNYIEFIRWIMIYHVSSAIQPLNNGILVPMWPVPSRIIRVRVIVRVASSLSPLQELITCLDTTQQQYAGWQAMQVLHHSTKLWRWLRIALIHICHLLIFTLNNCLKRGGKFVFPFSV